MQEVFRRCANHTSGAVGSSRAFIVATLAIVVWAVTGPLFGFSDTWQLVIHTGTTIITFLMVFLIQNTQNRDAKAIHLQQDELIRAANGARDSLVDLEELTDAEVAGMETQFRRPHERGRDCATAEALETVENELEERGAGVA